eukprot:260393_1
MFDAVETTKILLRRWSRTGTNHSKEIKTSVECLLDESTNKFLTAVKWAQFLHRCAGYFPDIQSDIEQIAIYCEKKAIEFIGSIQSNRLRLLLLEYGDALKLIIKHELKE